MYKTYSQFSYSNQTHGGSGTDYRLIHEDDTFGYPTNSSRIIFWNFFYDSQKRFKPNFIFTRNWQRNGGAVSFWE